ncbi:hypothetical protein AAG570_005463 [Ranatra chinensis]|uniref:Uncharacterized protein n=1 Tax=Ranatra chinensis TaxID=642074 RepID=A0ABD0YAD8_9HEMI
MAPALTEAAQSKNFNGLTSPSRLPLALKKYKRLKRTGPSDVGELGLAMNGHPPSSDVTYSINGLAKSLRNEFIPLDKTTNDKNSGPMGDSSENASSTTMGLQKSNEETDPGGFHKEKMTPGEVDLSQHFKNLGEMIASEVLATTGELSCQNVEEILQVISSMDNGSEMEESGVVAGDMTIFERDLFNVVDEIGICSEDKESLIGDRIEDIKTKQFQLKRKCDFLNRRLRKLRTKTVGRHVSSEITGVIEYTNNLLEAANRSRGYGPKGASLSSMSLLMRQLDHASTQQASALARSNNSRQCKYFGSGSSSYAQMTNGLRQNRPGSVLPPYKAEVRAEMERVAGELHSQLYMIQSEIDSDVTVTSSGGESCDEFTDYNNQYQQKHPM